MSRREHPKHDFVECLVCGSEFSEWGLKQHWAFNHDETIPRPWWPPVHEAERMGPRYSWARRQVIERDDGECQNCGRTEEADGVRIEVHHIVPFVEFTISGRAHAPHNLVTLCRQCHAALEKRTPGEQHQILSSSDDTIDQPSP